ncbi:MAG: CHASE domain-containing protein, partial [Treponema sp.]|nr:CHASE domain-containing protein [Treponema sp.]
MQSYKLKAIRFFLVFLMVLAIFLPIGYGIIKAGEGRSKEKAGYVAENTIGRMQNVYSNYMLSAKNMAGYVEGHNGGYMGITSIGENYIRNLYGIASLQLERNGIVEYCIPKGSGDIGYDVFAQDAKKDDAIIARDGNVAVLSGPYEMKQGGGSLVLRVPVLLNDEAGHKTFWGFSSVVIDLGQFFKTAGIKKLNDLDYSYQIWMHDKVDDIIFDGVIGEFESPVRKVFKYGDKDWYLYIEPKDGWINKGTVTLYIASSFLMALVLTILDSLVISIMQKNVVLKKQTSQLRISEKNERILRNSYEAAVESAELFLWELNLSDGSARLTDNPCTRKLSEAHKIPKEIPNLAQYVRERCPEKDTKILDDIFSNIRRGSRNVSAQIHFRSDGDSLLHTVKITYLIICDDYGKPLKGYGAAQDLTEDSAKRDGYNQERAFFSSYQGQDMVL